MYANILKYTGNRLKLLILTRSGLLSKMNSLTCTFHRLCYNIYIFRFYQVNTDISRNTSHFLLTTLFICSYCHFEPLYGNICCQIIIFLFLTSWLRVLKIIASCKLCYFVGGFCYIIKLKVT